MNIYAPNADNPTFFENVFEQVDSFDNKDYYIICGDFNLVLDPEIDDENYKSTNHSVNSRRILTSNINNRNLTDLLTHLDI